MIWNYYDREIGSVFYTLARSLHYVRVENAMIK